MAERQRIALITGANRGIGFEVARQLGRLGLKVILTSRDGLKGKAAADKLQSEGLDVVYYPLDVTREDSVRKARDFVTERFHGLDVLINNAGVFQDGRPDRPQLASVFDAEMDVIRESMETNAYGPLRLAQTFVPLMRQHGYGRIVNLSTGLAQLSEMRGSFAAYRISKASLNAVTRILAAELKGENILVNAVDPGWVRTKMGGENANRSPAEAAGDIVWAATLPDDGPTGSFLHHRRPAEW